MVKQPAKTTALLLLLATSSLAVLSGCGFSKRGAQVSSAASKVSSLSVTAFASTVYPYVRSNCVSCHGDAQTPKFAHADVKTAFDAALTVVSLDMPELSTIVRKVKDGHCGTACTTDGSQMVALINEWKAASAGGGGEEIRVGNIMTSPLNVPAPNPALCRSPVDLECPSDGLLNGQSCMNRCWTKLKFPARSMTAIGGAANTATASAKVSRSWLEIDFAYENYRSDSGPASYVLRNPRLISPDGPVYVFDIKLWLNGKYRPELGGAYRKIDTVVDKAIFGSGCTIPAFPTTFDPGSIGASCLPASQPLFSTAASAAGIIQEHATGAPDQLSFSFEYYQEGIAGECNDLDLFLSNVYAPIQRQAVACLDCHKNGGLVSEAGQRFNMEIPYANNVPSDMNVAKAVCKKFLQRSNFNFPDSSPIITQPTQGLNGMPAQPNFALFGPDWKAWIEREKGLAR